MNSPPTFLWKIPQFKYRKISKISPEAYTFQRPFLRGLCTEENLRFKVDRANLIVGRKFTVFALFYFAFEGNFPSTSRPPGGGGIFGGAYTWRGLFSEFYGRIFNLTVSVFCSNTNFCSRMLEMHSKRPRLQTFPEIHSFRALKSRLYSKFFLPHLLHILLKNPVFQTLIK